MSYFKNKECKKCGMSYDELASVCPNCKSLNEDNIEFRNKTKCSFIPPIMQLTAFLIGFIGVYAISFVFNLVFNNIYVQNNALGLTLANSLTYVVLAILLGLTIFRFYREFLPGFKHLRPYVAGLIGFVIIFVFNLLYGWIISAALPNIGVNENQTTSEVIVKFSPIVSVFVLGLLGPICEEITYRLGLYSLLRRKNFALALIVEVFVFAILHVSFFNSDFITELVNVPYYLCAALVFTLLYEKEGIAASTSAHVINNLYSVIAVIITLNIPK